MSLPWREEYLCSDFFFTTKLCVNVCVCVSVMFVRIEWSVCARVNVCVTWRENGYRGTAIIQKQNDKQTLAGAHAQLYGLLLY